MPSGTQHLSRKMHLIKILLVRNAFAHYPGSDLVPILMTLKKYPSSITYITLAPAVTFLLLFQIQSSHSHWSTIVFLLTLASKIMIFSNLKKAYLGHD